MRAQTLAHLGSFCLGFLACVVLLRGPALPSSRGGLGEEGRPAELPGWSGSPVGLAPSSDALGAKPAQDVSPTGSVSRQKVLAVIGVQTGFTTDPRPKYNYERRRAQLRAAWFPPNREAMDRLEREQGMVVRFAVGHSADPEQEAALDREAAEHGGFWRLDVQEAYLTLANKTLLFLTEAARRYDARYILKVDDDVYMRLDRVAPAIRQWEDVSADYVACMKTGVVIKSPRQRWYEPQHAVFGGSDSWYFTHGWGPAYVLSGRAAGHLAALAPGTLRFFANEDVTVGSWMLALNVSHYDDRRLCETGCSQSSLVVYDIPGCAGLCDPLRQLPELHNSSECHLPTLTLTGGLPLVDPLFHFDRRPDPRWELKAVENLKKERRQQAAALRAAQQAAVQQAAAQHGAQPAARQRQR